ncbi:aldose 1-epimerase [Ideonella sp. A 288]|uniref:aldose 1-epimerase n=1 Tax=Ideonella sp. A 288 TaxID=1962181 RepID=UPI000B4AD737|nr:aldose 1-epimerase [Ideonella sp. A 288]
MTDTATLQPRDDTIELRSGALRLALRPDLGGCVAGLWHHHVPVLRSTEPHALEQVRQSACFPLLPYSNRLGYRRFRFKGQDHTTEANFPDSPHSVHGVGWQRAWTLRAHSPLDVVMAYRHEPDGHWPFAFEAVQYLNLTPQGLRLQMTVTNTGTVPQPVGLGWHPYFPRRQRSRLHIELTDRWDADAAQLPTRKVPQPGIDGDVVHLGFDNCFEGWTGPARIRDEKFSLQLSSSMSRLVVYTPPDRDCFCVEPVSHVSNAIHMADPAAHGLVTLQPGDSTEAWTRLDVAPI